VTTDDLPPPTLLSRLLIAFTTEFDNEAEHRLEHRTTLDAGGTGRGPWLVPQAIWANFMQFVGGEGVPLHEVDDLARITNLAGLQRWGYAPGWARPCRARQDGEVIGRLHHVIVDCPDPAALARFYAELLGLPITWQEGDFAVVSRDDRTSGIGFQLAPDFRPPQWPDPARPQQMHFDVMVDDVDAAEPRVLALGARRLTGGDGGSRVYADPAGHPFCLIPRPGWAAPIGGAAAGE
jgi:catechol 2,3-dioxygenase-like lactoylglutathione lyase family enzyme